MSPPAVPAQQHQGILRHNSSSSSSRLLSMLSAKIKQVKVQQPQSMDLSYLPPQPISSSSLSSSSSSSCEDDVCSLPLVGRKWASHAAAATSTFNLFNPLSAIASVFRSFIPALQSLLIPTCHWLAVSGPPLNTHRSVSRSRSIGRGKRLLTGTFFGQKKGRVSFAIQETPRSEPILLLELATPTSHLVKEMASGMVRILLECNRNHAACATGSTATTTSSNSSMMMKKALWDEPVWTMYCNGHKLGYATARECTASDFHVLSTVQTVSAGAGVMPATPLLLPPPPPNSPKGEATSGNTNGSSASGGRHPEIMYMRAKFDRVIGSRDSEALYMINPDCTGNGDGSKFNSGGPELSIFMLRI